MRVSADPGLCQGRGGTWDHRRCGTWLPCRLPWQHCGTPNLAGKGTRLFKATTLAATCPCHLFLRAFKAAVCPPSNPPKPSKRSKPSRRPFQGNNSHSYMPLPCVFEGIQGCCLPALKPFKTLPHAFPKRSKPVPKQQLSQLHAPAICFSRRSRLPFARLRTFQTLPILPQALSKATMLAATCPCHLFLRAFRAAVCPPANPQNPPNPPSPPAGLSTTLQTPPRQQLSQLHAPAICF